MSFLLFLLLVNNRFKGPPGLPMTVIVMILGIYVRFLCHWHNRIIHENNEENRNDILTFRVLSYNA